MKRETAVWVGLSGGIILVWSIVFSVLLSLEFKHELQSASRLLENGLDTLAHVRETSMELVTKINEVEAWAKTYGKGLELSLSEIRAVLTQHDPAADWRARMEARLSACESRQQ